MVDCKNTTAADLSVVVQRQPAKHGFCCAHKSQQHACVPAVNDGGALAPCGRQAVGLRALVGEVQVLGEEGGA